MTVKELAELYLANRAQFYEALLPRIPHVALRQQLSDAVAPVTSEPELMDAAAALPPTAPSGFLQALALRDPLKKRGYGTAFGRTTISFEEALSRSQWIEETGLLLFSALLEAGAGTAPLAREITRRREALARLLHVEDASRYHRLPLR
jgi:hypothetical protein